MENIILYMLFMWNNALSIFRFTWVCDITPTILCQQCELHLLNSSPV